MEIPPRCTTAQRSALDPPDIRVNGSSPSDMNRSSSRSSSYISRTTPTISSSPMAIPNSIEDSPPPPLPPPKHPYTAGHGEFDIAQEWENRRQGNNWRSISPPINSGSSLYGSFSQKGNSLVDDRLEFNRRASTASTITSISADPYPKLDEGYASGTSFGSNFSKYHNSIPGRTQFQSSMHANFRSNSQPYDQLLIRKLESRRGTDNATPPQGFPRTPFSSSLNDTSPTRVTYDYQQPVQKAFSMPVRSKKFGLIESPLSRWAEGGLSPVLPPSRYAIGPYGDRDEAERSPLPFLRHSASGSLSNSEDYSSFAGRSNGDSDKSLDIDADFPMEEASFQRLRINDNPMRLEGHSPTSAAGQKRRASSPPREDGQPPLHTVGSASDLFRRRDSASRASPTPRLHSNHGSVSSIGSGPRNSSYISNLSLAATSITSMSSSYSRLSPGGPSPGGMSPSGLSPGGLSPGGLSPGGPSPGGLSPRSIDGGNESPYATSSPLTTSSHGSVSSPNHQHAILEVRPLISTRKSSERNLGPVKRITTDKLHRIFMCECCPKKPKKFDTDEELSAHEMEKQYECQYCKNRFKNKNEAERHQNSLHLRRHSWSCAALSDYSAAFHNSPTRPTEADTCGYCGEEFLRTNTGQQGIGANVAVEQDRETRIQHLVEVHKFRECNHAKKFFRADHFRQHLKHSHGGTSGKWTNMLENACMKDEPMPEPLPARINEEEEDITEADAR